MKIKIIKKYLSRLYSLLLNTVFPPVCMKCGTMCGEAGGVCAKCFSELTFVVEPFCHKCGKPLDSIVKEWGFCPYCQQSGKNYFDEARAALVYDENSSPLILALKYADKTELVPVLARWICLAAKDVNADLVVPVPLFSGRLRQRKYNQAALLAINIAKAKKVKYMPLLKRNKNTGSQGGLSRYKRKQNVKGAFSVAKNCEVKGKTVIIVDDVMTTGATMNECAKTLKKVGASKVIAVTLAVVLK